MSDLARLDEALRRGDDHEKRLARLERDMDKLRWAMSAPPASRPLPSGPGWMAPEGVMVFEDPDNIETD